MNRPSRTLLALLAALAVFLGACGGEEEPAAAQYRSFTSEEGKFKADFPGTPKREARTETAGDIRLNLVHFSVDNGDEAVSVSFIDYPPSVATQDPKALLNGIADGAATAADGNVQGASSELVSKTPTSFEGHEAIDFEVDIDERKLNARAVLVGTRMYLMQVVSEPNVDSASYERLTESFELTEASPPPPPPGDPAASPAAEASPSPSPSA
ncbi:MAG TPA: hypothetical protein VHJ78_08395 [Actinomycetota bacterium]|nr:hypothetical protein [Actinomycetota bacterium]